MHTTFSRSEDGQLLASIDGGHPVWNEALRDAISSAPPLGAIGKGPSTFWVDEAEAAVKTAARNADPRPFLSGETTALRLDGLEVVAARCAEEERIPMTEFLLLLARWRSEILLLTGVAKCAQPASYRREGRQ